MVEACMLSPNLISIQQTETQNWTEPAFLMAGNGNGMEWSGVEWSGGGGSID